MKYLLFSLLLFLAIAQLSAQEFKSITVGEYSTTIKDKRLALVIGNNEYSEVSKLSNPIKDAKAIKTALEACGFDVIIHENGTEKSIKEKVREFSEKLKSYDVGMFYYSGHGIEINGINYIVPVDIVRTASATDIGEECVATEFILSKMSEAGRTNKTYIMVLDACRDNPFKNIFKDLGSQTWKAPSVVPSGSITCFAASQGERAIEGKELSPYTELFLKHMKSPGLKIEDVFKRVRVDLTELKRSNPQIAQEPVELNKLTTEFFFVPVNDPKIPQTDTKPIENKNDLATLKILSTADGTIKIDGVQKGSIKANEIKVYNLEPGKYFVQLITDGDNLPLNEEINLSTAKTETLKFDILSKNPNKPQTESNKQVTDKIENNTLVISVFGQNLELYSSWSCTPLNWYEANEMCKKLGNGWRLPTTIELEQIYNQLYINGKLSFYSNDCPSCWSSTETSGRVWTFNFRDRQGYLLDKISNREVAFPVRNIPGTTQKEPIEIKPFANFVIKVEERKLEVYHIDFDKMDWKEARDACAKLGEGWRLPTVHELLEMGRQLFQIGNFKNSSYWTSENIPSPYCSEYRYLFLSDDISSKSLGSSCLRNKLCVRAVRSL